MFDILATPVGQLLALIHRGLSTFLIPSSGPAWALSIVLLTVTVRLLLFPLFVKQIKSQRRMQELAPKIKELQKQHKGDRETLNVEMMKLYKENNANPISGCLPLLLQLPVFFALFTVIRNFKTDADAQFGLTAQQLREGAVAKVFGAPISAAFNSPGSVLDDLGAEALTVRIVAFLMVIGMGASTFWTQRQLMARAGTTDPQQVMVQKLLLYVLPLSFAVSGVFFPIGVLLYWLTTNVWSMGQQAWVIKRMPPVNLNPGKPGPAGDGKGPKGGKPDKGPKGGSGKDDDKGDGGTPKPSGPTAPTGAATTTTVGGRTSGATPQAAVSAAGNRRPSGARKNKSRRGGRR
ncbi:MAG: oxaA [Frankiales bacterium]|nr:oxaA [Frankiales bacterium]